MLHRYTGHGLVIESYLPLAGLSPGRGGTVDIRIQAESSLAGPTPLYGVAWAVSRSEVFFALDGVASYRVRNGDTMGVELESGGSAKDAAFFLLGSPLAALLIQRRMFPFHCSAVDSPGGAILFLGRVGTGKSVLAAAMVRRGFPLIADGLLVARASNSQAVVVPSGVEHWLWSDSIRHLGLDPADLKPLREGLLKYRLPASSTQLQERPIKAIFVLDRDLKVDCAELPPEAVLECLQALSYQWRLVEALGQLRGRQSVATSLANQAAGYRLTVTKTLADFDLVVEKVMSRVEAPRPSRKVTRPGYVWLASYPKSGNTWLRAVFTAWRSWGREAGLEALERWQALSDRHIFDEIMGLDSALWRQEELLNWRSRFHRLRAGCLSEAVVTKVHDLYAQSPYGQPLFPPEATAGIVYVLRNPLDIALSYSNHFGLSLEQSVERMNRRDAWLSAQPPRVGSTLPQVLGSWSQHVLSWMEAAPGPRLLVRYEDLLRDVESEFRRVLDFLGLPWEPPRVQEAIRLSSFERLQEEEQRRGFLEERPRSSPVFFREGKAGGWREQLPAELARQIVAEHGAVMTKFGYAQEVEEVAKAWTR